LWSFSESFHFALLVVRFGLLQLALSTSLLSHPDDCAASPSKYAGTDAISIPTQFSTVLLF
jgi:hypothetical protein